MHWLTRWSLGLFIASSFLVSGSLCAQSLSLTVHNESEAYLADGSFQTLRFDDLLVRDQQNVWIQRILPAPMEKLQSNKVEQMARHLDLTGSARWIHKDSPSKKELSYKIFNPKDRTLVSVPKIEYGSVGFDGNWDRAYFLVSPELLNKMKKSDSTKDKATGNTIDRYEASANGLDTVILWNRDLKIPEKIINKSKNGLAMRTVTVTVNSKDAAITKPWEKMGKIIPREYEDYLD